MGFTSCSIDVYPPKVKVKTENRYEYKNMIFGLHSKWKTYPVLQNYVKYDKLGNVIEEGEYGEGCSGERVVKNPDGSETVILWDGSNYKKLRSVHYYQYDTITNKKNVDELWSFRNNNKNKLIYKTVFEYDINGQLTKETEYDDKKPNSIHSYQYDSTNKKIADEFWWFIDNKKELKSKTVLKYDTNGQLDTEIEYNKDNKVTKLHDYLKKGTTQSIEIIVEDGRKDTIISDSLGRPIEKIEFYIDGYRNKQIFRKKYQYDKKGEFVIELSYYGESGDTEKLSELFEWHYNQYKQLIVKYHKIIGDTTEEKDVYIYNRKKLLVKILHYNGNKLEGCTKYKYQLY